ncbi:S-adenosyl-L-methionine-dependent methyltransferase [Aspergillus pseudoustus]|uniref:S-adenosyl-L-methionine-dependent methyltransferase n=1 Tax=Aspergillus pseudoustus TaxID=1810923 RepID=A0ABR4K757_9EURO
MASTSNGLDEVTAAIAELSTIDASDPASRNEIVENCQLILDTLQDPLTVVMETLSSIVKFPCLAVINRLEIFKRLTSGPLTASELAAQCNADRWLIVRLMRAATAWGLVKELGPETYQATTVTYVFAAPPCAAGLRVGEKIHKILDSLPAYLEETDYRNPASASNGIFQYAFGTDQESFDFFAADKEYTKDFNTFMTVQRTRGQQWTEQFNVASRILDGVTIDRTVPLVVDVAGGVGQDLTLIKNAFQHATPTAGQLVLQELPHVIDNVPAELHDPDFEYVKHNFLTPQPVKGARIYALKHILHNWPDERALEILRNLAAALTPGYSKLWILDSVVPDTGADKKVVALDIAMLGFHGAQERNREQWDTLLAAAGFKVVDLSVLSDGFGLIEAELAA